MKITVEHIIQVVTREVIAELQRRGFTVVPSANQQPATSNQYPVTSNQQPATSNQYPVTSNQQPAPFEPDMSPYRTPVLTEVRLKRINPMVREIIIPAKTVLTPGARDYIRRNNLNIIYKS